MPTDDSTRSEPRTDYTPTRAANPIEDTVLGVDLNITDFTVVDDVEQPPVVPGYEVLHLLGKGAMGAVYLARQTRLNRLVALKRIRPKAAGSIEELVGRFLIEARSLARVEHNNVVKVHDFATTGDEHILVLEYLPGGSLTTKLKSSTFSDNDAAEVVEALARGVHAMHLAGVIHRDLKPSNVLYAADGTPKVTDFGLAKDGGSDLTVLNKVMGTVPYMSPEQARGRTKFAGPASDVWSLGVILYECLTRRLPFDGGTDLQTLERITGSNPSPMRDCGRSIPRDLETICLKCLAKEYERRYQTADDLAEDLARWRTGQPIRARRASLAERLVSWSRCNPTAAFAWGLGVLVVPVLLAIAVTVGIFWRQAKLDGERLARKEYARSVDMSHMAYQVGDVGRANDLLADQRPDLRGWEWNYLTRLCSGDAVVLKGHRGWVRAVRFDPSSRRLFTTGHDGTVRQWATNGTGEIARHQLTDDRVTGLAIDPTGRHYAVTSGDIAYLHDRTTGELMRPLTGHTQGVAAIAYSPDGQTVATASHDHTVKLWDTANGKVRRTLVGHTHWVLTADFSRDGRRLVTAGFDTTARIWDVETGRVVTVLCGGHTDYIQSAEFSPDGRFVLTCGNDHQAVLWDVESTKPVGHFHGHNGTITCGTFTPEGRWVVTAGADQTAKLWDPRTGRCLRVFRGHTKPIQCLAISPDGQTLATGSEDGSVRLWPLSETGTRDELAGVDSLVTELYIAPNNDVAFAGTQSGMVHQWDLATGRQGPVFQGHCGWVKSITVRPGHPDQVLTGSFDGTIRVWERSTGLPRFTLTNGEHPVLWVGFTDQAHRIRVVTSVAVNEYDADRGDLLATHPLFDPGTPGRALAASVTTDRLAIGLASGGVAVFTRPDAQSPFTRRDLNVPLGRYESLALHPDGRRLLVSSSDGSPFVWDISTNQHLHTLAGHTRFVRIVGISPDGRRYVTGGYDGKVIIWAADTGELLLRLSSRCHQPLLALAFSPDGTRLLSGGEDPVVTVWDARVPDNR